MQTDPNVVITPATHDDVMLTSALPLPTERRYAPMVGSAGLSLLVHGVILALFSVATWAIHASREEPPQDYSVHTVTDEPPVGFVGGFRFPGAAMIDQPDRKVSGLNKDGPNELAGVLSNPAIKEITPAPAASETGLGEILNTPLSRSDIVGGSGGGGGKGSGGEGSGLGDSDFAGGGPVGTLWGVGQGQNARSVVYVMDRSGSMTDTFTLLQHELMRAIGSLQREQLFNVLWFNEGKAQELFPRMKAATMENKRDAFEAIKAVVPSGQTQPLDALKRALAYKPDVMFLLSDGDFGDDNKRIIQTLKQLNASHKTKINTILFVYDTMGEGERVLQEIAQTHRGTYKHVTEEDVRK